MSDTITINIKSSGDSKYEVSVEPSNTIEDLKAIISTKADVPPESQRLIYSGKILKDPETVASYKIQNGHTVHLVKSAAAKAASSSSNAPSALTNSGNATNNSSNNQSSTGSEIPSNIAAGQGSFNPLADLTGARYAGYTQLPSASMFGPDGGMGSMPDPDQMGEMMSNPMFQEQMNALLSNPQMLDFIINQNPQLRAMGPQVRSMLQSPMFREMMSNPETMRSMMNMSRGMGGAGAGAGGSFPAPGANPTVESEGGAAGESGDSNASNQQAPANPFASMFPNGIPPMDPMAMFGGAGPGAGAGGMNQQAPQDNRPPEERYATQLGQLNDMGFFDFDQNVAALRRSGGSVQGAVEYLLSNSF